MKGVVMQYCSDVVTTSHLVHDLRYDASQACSFITAQVIRVIRLKTSWLDLDAEKAGGLHGKVRITESGMIIQAALKHPRQDQTLFHLRVRRYQTRIQLLFHLRCTILASTLL